LNTLYNSAQGGLEGGYRTNGFHFSDSYSRQIGVIVHLLRPFHTPARLNMAVTP
jgi:hypothetical protein